MKQKLLYLAVLACGAAIGSAATHVYFKNKFEKKYQEDVKSVKEAFSKREKNLNASIKEVEEVRDTLKEAHQQMTNTMGYSNYKPREEKKEEVNQMVEEKPYVITPEEFGEYEEYETITLTYYADEILTDIEDEIIEDIPATVGYDSFTHFGEYEEDCVHVRNDELKCDYEILRDYRRFADVYSGH